MSDSIQSVKVLSIDEEKLKYRVLLSIDAQNSRPQKGRYNFVLPPLSSFGNSNHFQQCKIHLDAFSCNCINAVINDMMWDVTVVGGVHTTAKVGCLEITLDAPGAQSALNHQTDFNPGDDGVGKMNQGGFRQLVPIQLTLNGGLGGALTAGLTNLGEYSYTGIVGGSDDGIMCANPFGSASTVTIRFPGLDSLAYLVSQAAGADSADRGLYNFQFTITMIPNRD